MPKHTAQKQRATKRTDAIPRSDTSAIGSEHPPQAATSSTKRRYGLFAGGQSRQGRREVPLSFYAAPDTASETDPEELMNIARRYAEREVPSRSTSLEVPVDSGAESMDTEEHINSASAVLPDKASSREPSSAAQLAALDNPDEALDELKLVIPEEASNTLPDEDTIPIRVLDNFVIYEIETRRMVYLEEVHASQGYGATGYVTSFVNDDSDSVSEEEDADDESAFANVLNTPLVQLSAILEVNVNHIEDYSQKTFCLDTRIWISTAHAWYILKDPAPPYLERYAPFQVKHRLFHELLACVLQDPERKLTLEEFEQYLTHLQLSISGVHVSGELLTSPDAIDYICEAFNTLCKDKRANKVLHRLRKVPIIASLLHAAKLPATNRTQKSIKYHAYESKTTVTPKVYDLAARLFPQEHLQEVPMDDPPRSEKSKTVRTYRTHGERIEHKWGPSSSWRAKHYESVVIDGVVYKIGDTVAVTPGKDSHRRRAKNALTEPAKSGDKFIDTKWFMKICHFFERRDKEKNNSLQPYFHGQHYEHGSKLLLQQMAHRRALYLMDECDDQPLGCIFQKLDIHELDLREDDPPESAGSCPRQFFSGMLWEQTAVAFRQLSAGDMSAALQASNGSNCLSCGLTELRARRASGNVEKTQITRHDVRYHVHDFVYLRPVNADPRALYTIGQIIEIVLTPGKGEHQVRVRLLARYDSAVNTSLGSQREDAEMDERRLFLTNEERSVGVSCLEGKAFAAHPSSLGNTTPDDWVWHDDHYLVHLRGPSSRSRLSELQHLLPRELKRCKPCFDEHMKKLKEDRELLDRNGPLRTLELFAGAGGLAAGLHESGFVETKWAVESLPSAALSFKKNNPGCTVYTQDSNVLLQHTIESHRALKPKSLSSRNSNDKKLLPPPKPLPSRNPNDKKPLPPMPKPGDVDFICGGPPCQSFSGANRLKKIDDIRTTLVCNMLSYVEFYRPKYFLLENVTGLLILPLKAEQRGQMMVGGIAMGVVKFIFRTLVSLGYQVHCKVLQAAQYGAPQARERVFFWAARRDVPLPNFPWPTHHYARGAHNFKLPTGEELCRPVRVTPHESAHGGEYEQYAPLRGVTVEDAISDLRRFEWKYTADMVGADMDEPRAEDMARFNAVLTREVGGHPVAGYDGTGTTYRIAPRNRYQHMARDGLEDDAKVEYHYTQKFTAKIVERVLNVPLRPGANHQDLPPELRDARKLQPNGKSRKEYERHYKRIDGEGQFSTVLTAVKPHSMNAVVLHPTQKRVLTVRECARAQGFRDSHQFLSVYSESIPAKVAEDQLRQIGNAVPVPLARALGKELGKALLKTWREEDAAGEPMEVD
ncbi:BAH and Dcm domain-containing protein [Phanerochaete sordida]|uniref:Cytosine-specific methyltransferase n=1 Tax=Phanerochaete sordida TaxID=48140 RepID=A0A9P3G384_9APHY|nr:BAH and Dcm domain-containing protein [Phanerochaete sordida]